MCNIPTKQIWKVECWDHVWAWCALNSVISPQIQASGCDTVWLIDHTLPRTHTIVMTDQFTSLGILTTRIIVPTQNSTRTGETRTTSFT